MTTHAHRAHDQHEPEGVGMTQQLTIGDLTEEHVGRPIYGIEGNAGWERNLLLQAVEHNAGETRVMFRWNDDPSPQNTRRGQFACGFYLPPDTPCSLTPAETTDPRATAREDGGDRG